MPEKSKTYDQRKSRAQSRDEKSAPRVYIRTFGCQMNDRDSEFIVGLFLQKSYELTTSPEKADVIIFNTCSVRKHAEERAIQNMALLMSRYKNRIYAMAGCTAQALKGKLFERLPKLNLVCGTGEIHSLPKLVEESINSRVLAIKDLNKPLPELNPSYRVSNKHAYVSIMRGCNSFCSYCIVPYVRGRECSRKAEDIIKEINDLARRGITDITLLGQNVNSYESRRRNFVDLLRIVNNIEGIGKIYFLTSHPKDATIKLFRAMRELDKVAKHLHLPLQSGSDRILGLMKRCYTARKYLGIIKKLRNLVPQCKITTDIIVGFPTETEKDFNDTLGLLKKIEFDSAYIFKYSPRPGTEADKLRDDVPKEEKERRHGILLNLQKELFREKSYESIRLRSGFIPSNKRGIEG